MPTAKQKSLKHAIYEQCKVYHKKINYRELTTTVFMYLVVHDKQYQTIFFSLLNHASQSALYNLTEITQVFEAFYLKCLLMYNAYAYNVGSTRFDSPWHDKLSSALV